MEEQNINEVMDLWHKDHLNYCNNKFLQNFFPGGKQNIKNYLIEQIKKGNAILVKDYDNSVLGYFSWVYINFHNERSVLCPTIGHCSRNIDKENIYTHLYNHASKEWIKNDTFNHLWMIYFKDILLREFSYNLGFGSYVGDAIKQIEPIRGFTYQYKISRATEDNVDILYGLLEESRHFYLDPPVFLKRPITTKDKILKMIEETLIFLAWENNEAIGFIHIWKNDEYHIENLSIPGSISLGIFIKSEHRNKGIGKSLLNKVYEYCDENSKKYAHVSFETSNINANRFWIKNFEPIILSVRRTINKDANQ